MNMDILCRMGVTTVRCSKSDRNALDTIIANCRDLGKKADDMAAAELVPALENLRDRYPPPAKKLVLTRKA